MKILSRQKYLELSFENCFAIYKTDGAIHILADIENNDNLDAEYPMRIEEYPHWWKLPENLSLIEGLMLLRGKERGGIAFVEDCDDVHSELLNYLSNPVIIYAENDMETTDILKVIQRGEYIIVIGDEPLVNEFDNPEDCTLNYMDYKNQMRTIGLNDIYGAVNVMRRLEETGIMSEAMEITIGPLKRLLSNLQTEEKCTKCGKDLYKSDLPQYDYYCIECDENF